MKGYGMVIERFELLHLPQVLRLWNQSVSCGEMLYRPLTDTYFHDKFLDGKHHENELLLVAREAGAIRGFIAGCRLSSFLPGQNDMNTPGYLTMLLVDKDVRRQGIGSVLLSHLEDVFRALGKKTAAVSSLNPVNLDWVIPGTMGHEHNNAPGVDEAGPAYSFLQKRGYLPQAHEVAMYLNLADFQRQPNIEDKRNALRQQGITAGLYNPALAYEFDTMCDRVKSEYWRKVLREEVNSPKPRPILAATIPGHIVAFTGPVDRQDNGRGWFTGICTDPLYEKRGIATVLFSDLMEQFIQAGALYSTLFTGTENHAQRLYLKTGFRPVRHFAIMEKQLEGLG